MSKNAKLRTRITAILLAFVMAASLLVTGIGIGADVKAATEKTVEIIYTGTEDPDLYLDCYDNGGSSWEKSWNLFSQDFIGSSDYFSAFSKTVDSKGYTHFTVTFDSDNIYNIGFQLSVNWKYIEFTDEDITNGDLKKYVDGEGNVSKTAPVDTKTVEIVYTGTDDTDLYLDCYDNGGSSWEKSWNLLSESYVGSSDYFSAYSKTVDSNGYTHFTVAFDYEKIYNVGFQLNVNWAYVEFTDAEIGSGSLVKYVDSEGNITTTAPSTPAVPKTTYTVNIHVYGQDAKLGVNFHNNDSNWTSNLPTTNATLSGDWASVTYTYESTEEYANAQVSTIDGTTWTDYDAGKLDENNSATLWIVPDLGKSYATEAAALEAIANANAVTYTVNINVHGKATEVGVNFHKDNSNWTSNTPTANAVLSGNWATASYEYKSADEYNTVCVQLIENGTWDTTKYEAALTDNSATLWIVPDLGKSYATEAAALEAIANASVVTYTVNINVYGKATEVGVNFHKDNSNWTSNTPTANAVLSGDWATASYEYKSADEYNNVCVQLIENGTWGTTKYEATLTDNSATLWIVPDLGKSYATEAEALEAIASVSVNTYTVNINVYGKATEVGVNFYKGDNWTKEIPTTNAVLSGDWATASYEYKSADEYNNVCVQLIENGTWGTTKYEAALTDNSATLWIVPDLGKSYATEAEALKAMTSASVVKYNATIHVYGQDASVGGWMIHSEDGTEDAWLDCDSTATGTLSGEWSTMTLTTSVSDGIAYNGIGVQLIENGTWLDTKYKQFFDGTSCEMWIVPEVGSCFDNEADALAALADPATSSTIIVHYKNSAIAAWMVGSWYTSEINGSWGDKDTKFTYQDDWGYVAIVEYPIVVNEIGFKLHQQWKFDGIANNWYIEDGDNRTINLTNGFAEVWLTKGSDEVLYTCPDNASEFSTSTATRFRNYNYIGRSTAKGVDAELVFHYFREDGVYDEWAVGIWAEVTSGTWKDAQITQNKELDEYGAATYTVDLSYWPKTEIGFAVNYNNWEKKDYEADRYVDVSKIEAGQVLDVYIYENDGNIYFEPRTAEVSETDAAGVDADVVFHYSRTNGDYEGWMVGLWCEKADGTWVNDNVAFDGTDADGLATVTIDLSKFPAESLGFKINKDNWASEDGGDRSIDLTAVTEGQVIDVYIYEGDGEVYFEPQGVEEEPDEEVTATDVVEEPVEEPEEETKGGCAGCTGCTGCAILLPVLAMIAAGALFIFRKRA